jgi:hypothetical protein
MRSACPTRREVYCRSSPSALLTKKLQAFHPHDLWRSLQRGITNASASINCDYTLSANAALTRSMPRRTWLRAGRYGNLRRQLWQFLLTAPTYYAQPELLRQALVSQGQTGSHPSSKEMHPAGLSYENVPRRLRLATILSHIVYPPLYRTGFVGVGGSRQLSTSLFALGHPRWQRASESTAPPPLIIAAFYMTMRE